MMRNPEFIHAVVFSSASPHWQTRKLVCELLVFLCYSHSAGHKHVLQGFELLQQHKKDAGLFDTWMRDLEQTIDGRGRMGSLVDAHQDLKRLGVYNAPDNHLMEYAVSILNVQ